MKFERETRVSGEDVVRQVAEEGAKKVQKMKEEAEAHTIKMFMKMGFTEEQAKAKMKEPKKTDFDTPSMF